MASNISSAAVRMADNKDYPLDAGPNPDEKLFSLRKALHERNLRHPRPVPGSSKPFPYCKTRTGCHCCGGMCSRSDFEPYGNGIVLYFKALKFFGALFFVLSIFALPSMLFYALGSSIDFTSPGLTEYLSLFSIGHLGEAVTICRDGYPGDRINIQCPVGSRIGKIEAYYGDIAGQCECPNAQIPNPACPGTLNADGTCDGNSYCHLESARPVQLPSGSDFVAGSCCSSKLVDGRPDFSDLDFSTPNPGCLSSTSLQISRGVCLGENSCNLTVSDSRVYTWKPSQVLGTACTAEFENPDGTCSASLGHSSGNFTQCPTDEQKRLVVVGKCYQETVEVFGVSFTRAQVALLLTGFDTLYSLIFLFSILWLRKKEKSEAASRTSLTAADYTVLVKPMPKGISLAALEQRLKAHFDKVVPSLPVSAVRLAPLKRGHSRVADINFGLNNRALLRVLKKRAKIAEKVYLLKTRKQLLEEKADWHLRQQQRAETALETHNAKADQTHWRSKVRIHRRDYNKLLKDIDKVRADLAKLLNRKMQHAEEKVRYIERNDLKAANAFVTFESRESFLRVTKAYHHTSITVCCQSSRLRFNGRAIRVKPAPGPSDIIWENQDLGKIERCCRLAFTTIIALGLLLASAVGVYYFYEEKRATERLYPDVNCDTLVDYDQKETVIRDWRERGYDIRGSSYLQCYCKDILFQDGLDGLQNEEFDVTFPSGQRRTYRWCRDWLESYVTGSIWRYGSVVAILLINLLLRFTFKRLVGLEASKYKTVGLVSRMYKLFVVQVLNTALVVLLVNAQLDTSFAPLRRGKYRDFTEHWFLDVGVSLTLTMIFNIFIPHFTVIGEQVKLTLKRAWDRKLTCNYHITRKKTQAALEDLHLGPEFLLAERYAVMLNVIFVTMFYSTGLPLLFPIAMVSFFIAYWVDKALFTRFYRTPPAYDTSIARAFSTTLPWALLFHLAAGMWMMSNEDVFPPSDVIAMAAATPGLSELSGVSTLFGQVAVLDSDSYQISRVTSLNTIPLFLLFAIILVVLLLNLLLFRQLRCVFRNICGCCTKCVEMASDDRVDVSKERTVPNYFAALPTDVIYRSTESDVLKPQLRERYEEEKKKRTKQLLQVLAASNQQMSSRRMARHRRTQRLSAAGPQREHKQRHTRSATVELKPVHLESKPSGGPRHRHAASVDASGFDKTEAKSTEARMVDSPSSAGSPASPTSSTPPTPSSPSSALDDVVITQELSRFLIPHIEAYTATRARIRQYEEQLAEQMAIVASLDSKLNSIATRGTGSAQDAAVLKQDKDRAEASLKSVRSALERAQDNINRLSQPLAQALSLIEATSPRGSSNVNERKTGSDDDVAITVTDSEDIDMSVDLSPTPSAVPRSRAMAQIDRSLQSGFLKRVLSFSNQAPAPEASARGINTGKSGSDDSQRPGHVQLGTNPMAAQSVVMNTSFVWRASNHQKGKVIEGLHSYDIHENRDYALAFGLGIGAGATDAAQFFRGVGRVASPSNADHQSAPSRNPPPRASVVGASVV